MSTTPPLSMRTPPSGLWSKTSPTFTVSCGSRWTFGSSPCSRMFWTARSSRWPTTYGTEAVEEPLSESWIWPNAYHPATPARTTRKQRQQPRPERPAPRRRLGVPVARPSRPGGLRGGMIEVGAAPRSAPERTIVAASAVSAVTPRPRADALQLGVHLLGRLEAVVRVLRERAEHDHVEVGRDVGPLQRRRPRRVGEMLHRDLDRRLAAERRLAGEHLVEDDADRVEVGALVDGGAARLLGREVLRRPDDRAGLGHLAHARARDAEVRDLEAPVRVGHHVVRLDVPVDDALAVREAERREHLARRVDRVARSAAARARRRAPSGCARRGTPSRCSRCPRPRRGRRSRRCSDARGRPRSSPRGGSARRTARRSRAGR